MISKKTLSLAALIGLLGVTSAGCLPLNAQTPPAPAPAAAAAKPAATVSPATVEAAIRAIMERQAFDWNRGDTDGFLLAYAEDAIFVSDTITRGLDKLRARYQSHYPTRASMGKLTFSDLEIKMIDANAAVVIGRFKLERDAEGGGDTQGVYTLLFKRGPKGWKIAIDHTS
jgi:uncharacterized protein (TIGR02246 family)